MIDRYVLMGTTRVSELADPSVRLETAEQLAQPSFVYSPPLRLTTSPSSQPTRPNEAIIFRMPRDFLAVHATSVSAEQLLSSLGVY